MQGAGPYEVALGEGEGLTATLDHTHLTPSLNCLHLFLLYIKFVMMSL